MLHIHDLSFRYDQEWVLRDLNLSVYRGDKLAMVGVNGAGQNHLHAPGGRKLQPRQGTLEIGKNATIGYYAQHQIEALNLEARVYDEVLSTAAEGQRPRVRDVLGMFNFTVMIFTNPSACSPVGKRRGCR